MKKETIELLHQIIHRNRKYMHAHLERLGLYHGQPRLLYLLGLEDGRTKKELAECIKVSAPTITKMVERMEKNGFVYTAKDAKDNRVSRVYLAEKGKAVLADLDVFRKETKEQYLKGLSDQEVELLHDLLHKIADNIPDPKEG